MLTRRRAADDGKRFVEVRAAVDVSWRGKKEMILRRLGEGFGEGKGSGVRRETASADF